MRMVVRFSPLTLRESDHEGSMFVSHSIQLSLSEPSSTYHRRHNYHKLLIRLLLDLIRVMSTSLQNFHYFPPFCMLPQADELDPNYYSENGQGMWLHIGSQLIVHVPRKILEYETKILHGCVSCREITPLFRHAPPFTDLVLCSRNRERCSFASSGSGAPVRDGQVVEL